jgi:hypothetical protein
MTIPIKCLKFPYSSDLLYLGVLAYFNYITVIIDNTNFLLKIGGRANNEIFFWSSPNAIRLGNADESPPLKRGTFKRWQEIPHSPSFPKWGDLTGRLFSVHKWPFSAISASIGGIACAAYKSTPPRNSLISLNLQKMAISGSETNQCP